MSQLSSELAEQLVGQATTKATELGIKVCVAIVDDGAHLLEFRRMDGAFKGSIDVAIKKAKTSALFPFPTGGFGEAIRNKQLTGMELSNGGLTGFAGGLPLMQDDVQVGAIGISGGSAEQDLEIAEFAAANAGVSG